MSTKVVIEGQADPILIPDTLANDDDAIIRVITPYYPQAAEAELERKTEANGDVIITVTPQGKTKG